MLEQIISSDKADGSILGRAGQVILHSKTPFTNGEKMFDQILNSNRAESNTFVLIGAAVFNSKLDLESSQKMLARVLDAPKFAADSTFSLALTLGSSNLPDSTVKTLFRQLVNSSKTNAATLKDVVDRLQYTGDTIPKQRASELLDLISKSPSADTSVQKSVGNAKLKLQN